jgi:hypothetical protein
LSAQTPLFYPKYGLLVKLNSGFDTCYGVDPIVEKIDYICEVLARLLFMYDGNVDFEVIWFLEKTMTDNFAMGFRTQLVYATIITFVL